MNKIKNLTLLIKPDETPDDILAEICDELNIKPDEHFLFSAIMMPTYNTLKINYFVDKKHCSLSPEDIVSGLRFDNESLKTIQYVRPPLEDWLDTFAPFLSSLVDRVSPSYEKLIPDRDDRMSILTLSVCELYYKGYYLHQYIVYKTYINALNLACRKPKNINTISLDIAVSSTDENELTLADIVPDIESTEWARQSSYYTESDVWDDRLAELKEAMLRDMSPLAYDLILIQLSSKTITTQTSRTLSKYRRMFDPENARRRGRTTGKTSKRNPTATISLVESIKPS